VVERLFEVFEKLFEAFADMFKRLPEAVEVDSGFNEPSLFKPFLPDRSLTETSLVETSLVETVGDETTLWLVDGVCLNELKYE
jgi:hypothetical protein